MKLIKNICYICCSLLILSPAIAKPTTEIKKPIKHFSGDVHFGMLINTGNSKNKNIFGKLVLKYKRNNWQLEANTNGQLSTSKEEKTAQNFSLAGTANYYFKPRHSAFTKLDYTYNQFSPYLCVYSLIVGYGWKAIDKEKIQLMFKVGPGFRHQKEATSEKTNTDPIGYASGELVWKITKNATFKQLFSAEGGKHNVYNYSKTALSTKIIGNLGVEISFIVKHNTDIPKLSKNKYKTDASTNVLLVYSF